MFISFRPKSSRQTKSENFSVRLLLLSHKLTCAQTVSQSIVFTSILLMFPFYVKCLCQVFCFFLPYAFTRLHSLTSLSLRFSFCWFCLPDNIHSWDIFIHTHTHIYILSKQKNSQQNVQFSLTQFKAR